MIKDNLSGQFRFQEKRYKDLTEADLIITEKILRSPNIEHLEENIQSNNCEVCYRLENVPFTKSENDL